MMRALRSRLLLTLLLLLSAVAPAIEVTRWIFAKYEGRPVAWHEALLFLAETMTTVGYGSLAPFRSPVTVLFSLVVMALGFGLIFVYLTAAAGDWLASRFQELPPAQAPRSLKNHIVICGYTPLVEALLVELKEHVQPFVVLEPRADVVLRLRRAGLSAVFADPTLPAGLAAGNLGTSRALVADLDDNTNATILLQARHLRAGLDLIGTVEHAGHEKFLTYAGATRVISPKEVIAERIARWVREPIPEALSRLCSGQVPGLEILHLYVAPHSPLEGASLRTARLREKFGVSVVAIWRRGQVILAPGPAEALPAGSVMTAVGLPKSLSRLQAYSGIPTAVRFGRPAGAGEPSAAAELCVVVGYGDVGAGVVRRLAGTGRDLRVVSLAPPPLEHAFTSGDATDEDVLRRAGLPEASAFVVALNDDPAAIFTTLMARRIHPDVRIVARANHLESVASLYMAGADYVLSVPEVSGAALAETLLSEADRPPPTAPEATLAERPIGPALVGVSLARSDIGRLTGCAVVAVRRHEQLHPAPAPDFQLKQGDDLILFGTVNQVAAFDAL